MAKQNVTVELFYNSTWNGVTDHIYNRDQMNINRGVKNPGDQATTSTATFTFDNRSGDLNPRNPRGELFGKIGQNTPIRITVGSDERFYGQVVKWKPERAIKGDAWVRVEATGVLDQLGKGLDVARGALERKDIALGPAYLWPMTDGANATSLGGYKGTPAMPRLPSAPSDVELAKVAGPAGAPASYPELRSDTVTTGDEVFKVSLDPDQTDDGWSIEFIHKASTTQTAEATVSWPLSFITKYYNWSVVFLADPANEVLLQGFSRTDNSGASDISFSHTFSSSPLDGQWHHWRFGSDEVADAFLYIWRDGELLATDTTSVTGVVGGITEITVQFDPLLDSTEDSTSLGELAIFEADPSVDNGTYDAFLGYAGELAEDRFSRICGEESISDTVVGDPNGEDSTRMGPQPLATVLDVLAEVERTDDANIFETRNELGLTIRTGRSKMNQDPALTLSYEGGQIAPGLDPVVGDEHIRNDVTAAGRNSTFRQAIQETGPNNVQAPADDSFGVGRYTTRVDASTYEDDTLLDVAQWRVHKGTFDSTWYAQVTADLDADQTIVSDAAAVDVGDLIRLTNLPEDEAPDSTVDHIVIGIDEQIGTHRRTITFHLEPGRPYVVGVLGSTGAAGYLDCKGSALAEVLDTTETGIDLTITDSCTWTHASGDYDVVIGREVMTVTAVGSVTGTFPSRSQTLTVTRSANGAVLTHAIGEEVHVLNPFVLVSGG